MMVIFLLFYLMLLIHSYMFYISLSYVLLSLVFLASLTLLYYFDALEKFFLNLASKIITKFLFHFDLYAFSY